MDPWHIFMHVYNSFRNFHERSVLSQQDQGIVGFMQHITISTMPYLRCPNSKILITPMHFNFYIQLQTNLPQWPATDLPQTSWIWTNSSAAVSSLGCHCCIYLFNSIIRLDWGAFYILHAFFIFIFRFSYNPFLLIFLFSF